MIPSRRNTSYSNSNSNNNSNSNSDIEINCTDTENYIHNNTSTNPHSCEAKEEQTPCLFDVNGHRPSSSFLLTYYGTGTLVPSSSSPSPSLSSLVGNHYHSSTHSNHHTNSIKTTATMETATLSSPSSSSSSLSFSKPRAKAQSVDAEVNIDDEERFWLRSGQDDDADGEYADVEEQEKMEINPDSTATTNTSGTSPSTNTNTNTTSTTTSAAKKATLKLSSLAILVFYNVSGGPFGIEPTIRSAGNLFAILGFIIGPLIWSIPEALITAELGSAFRHDASGGVAWVEEAFGTKMGMVCGFFSWISGATDNAIYPTLFLQYFISVVQQHQQQQSEDEQSSSSSSSLSSSSSFSYYDYDTTTMWYDNNVLLFAFVVILSILLALLNYRGLEIVGNASIIVSIIAMSPFVLMTIIGIPKIDSSRWLELPDAAAAADYYGDTMDMTNDVGSSNNGTSYNYNYGHEDNYGGNNNGDGDSTMQLSSWLQTVMDSINGGGILWTPYLNNLFWNLNSFDAAASFAGEVQSPSKTYPNGIFWGLFLTVIFYLVPLFVVIGATDYKQNEWADGQLGQAAIDIGGNWLGTWTVFAAGISNLALFEAELSSDSYQLMGMAERGYLPKVFARRSDSYGTPTVGILTCTLVIIALSVADFMQLVELLNFNYAIALLMEYAAFVKLRLTRKDLQRPYRIPIPDWAAILIIIPPCLGILLLCRIASWVTYGIVMFGLLMGLVCYYLQQLAKRKGLCTFVDPGSFEESYASRGEIT